MRLPSSKIIFNLIILQQMDKEHLKKMIQITRKYSFREGVGVGVIISSLIMLIVTLLIF